MKKETVTGRINKKALEILARSSKGVRWADLNRKIQASDTSLHPKTINGCVWRLTETYPDKVYKPEKGLFMHTKYRK